MRSGRLRHLVTLQRPTGSRDAVGERVTVWVDVAEVYASINPLSATETFIAQQEHQSTSHLINVRYDATQLDGITSAWRVVYGSRIFAIDGVVNVGERNREMELRCTEGLREQ